MSDIEALLAAFEQADPRVQVWKRVPDVEEGADDEACEELSAAFTAFCLDRGHQAETLWVEGFVEDAHYHCWTRVVVAGVTWSVDWTARQFHNLENPEAPEHQDLPCPLYWRTDQLDHPVLTGGRQREPF